MKRSRRSFFAATVGFAVIGIVWVLIGMPSSMTAQPSYSDWAPPHNLGAIVNSTANDAGPTLSKDRLSLYFGSNRSGSLGGNTDIWVSQRNSEEGDWGPPTNLGAVINSTAEDTSPNLSRDGHWLFFMSRRPGSQANAMGIVGFDIWVSYREHVHDDFDWQAPVNVAAVNSPSFDQSPFFFENEEAGIRQLFFTRTTPITGNDIFLSNQLPDGTFGPPTLVSELNSALSDAGSSIRFDGLEVFFFSRRAGGLGNSDLWTATRDTVLGPWSVPIPLGAVVNSADLDFDPFIASDRETLYFASTRSGGVGGQDLWVTTRTKAKHKS